MFCASFFLIFLHQLVMDQLGRLLVVVSGIVRAVVGYPVVHTTSSILRAARQRSVCLLRSYQGD